MNLHPAGLPGVFIVESPVYQDRRGDFFKIFHETIFQKEGIQFRTKEIFVSISRQGVIRGMHFQVPPAACAKLVSCLQGTILDVLLDLRRSSPAFGRHVAFEMGCLHRQALYIPSGVAHGFLSLENDSVMLYGMDGVHAPTSDVGVAWNSFGFAWPCATPTLSDRDLSFPRLADYASPFP